MAAIAIGRFLSHLLCLWPTVPSFRTKEVNATKSPAALGCSGIDWIDETVLIETFGEFVQSFLSFDRSKLSVRKQAPLNAAYY
jgi:hypothetical protein